MPSQWPCLVVMLILCCVFFSIGAYYTMKHKISTQLVSCFQIDGKCREFWNCEEAFQSREITTCINKRKVCCLKTSQIKNILDADEFMR
ncbi:hypothetical protein KR026_001934 [Drosophila bipectinata]|nr:hypothetical protein KR026_001934 [Drosophila bipectinata]